MQVHSIISNTISEDVLEKGHLSIRFLTDGFSLLLADEMYRPVILTRHSDTDGLSLRSYISACTSWLTTHEIIDRFQGEATISLDQSPSTLIPKDLLDKENPKLYLEQVSALPSDGRVLYKKVKGRPFALVYFQPEAIQHLLDQFSCSCRFISTSEIHISLADQVKASDHQRGFCLLEVQNAYMNIVIIKDDNVILLNKLRLKTPNELVYQTLHILEELNFDRKGRPLYLAGVNDSTEILKKYIKNVMPVSYYIQEIDKSYISEHILLAEATRCE